MSHPALSPEELIYLNFVQTNGNMQRSQQVAQGKQEAMGQQSVLIEHNGDQAILLIPAQNAADMKDITDHAQGAIVRQGFTAQRTAFWGLFGLRRGRGSRVEPVMRPHNDVV